MFVGVVGVMTIVSSPLRAQSGAGQSISSDVFAFQGCGLPLRESVWAASTLELSVLDAEAKATVGEVIERIEVSCHARHVRIRLITPSAGSQLQRSVEGLGTATRNGRLIALAASELLVALHEGILLGRSAAVRREKSALEEEQRRWRIQSHGGVIYGGAPGFGRLGGGITVGVRPWSRLSLSVDVWVAGGGRTVDAGRVDRLEVTGAMRAGLVWVERPFELELAAGYRVGWTRLSAQQVGNGLWSGPALVARPGIELGRWLLSLHLEGGVAIAGARGLEDDRVVVDLEGLWGAIAVAGGLAIP